MRNNAPRIIPFDDRPNLPAAWRQWSADSRGRWDGNTLIVETTNFNDKIHFNGSTEARHVVERATRVDNETIRYESTVDDHAVWDRS